LNTNYNYNKPAGNWNKPKKGSSSSTASGESYQRFLEFLDSSGNSEYIRKKITQIEAFKKSGK
jgi:hypothetical protein